MRIAWATDIHLNFLSDEKLEPFIATIAGLSPDVVVVTGDISEAPALSGHLQVLEAVGVPVYFVLGNHDYYGSSVGEVRSSVRELTRDRPLLSWLPAAGVVRLTDDCALVGVDGWGDARLGDPETPLVLSDFVYIRDLAGLGREARNTQLNAFGDDEAAALAPMLDEALASVGHVIVATHVPPFRQACWHEGQISNDQWLPFFTCKAIGDLLASRADEHPDVDITVLCGHTHGRGEASIRANLRVLTGAADYGAPVVRALDI